VHLIYQQLLSADTWRSAGKGFDGLFLHSRNVYVLLSRLRDAGVYSGLDSEAGIANPDNPPATRRGGFFIFCAQWTVAGFCRPLPTVPISAGGEAVNAQVCKTCIRGFNSRPALQISMSEHIPCLLLA